MLVRQRLLQFKGTSILKDLSASNRIKMTINSFTLIKVASSELTFTLCHSLVHAGSHEVDLFVLKRM